MLPLLFPLAIPFLAMAAALILIGLSQTSTAQHGSSGVQGFLAWMAHGGPIASLYGQVVKAIRFVVSHFADAQLVRVSKWFVAIGTLTQGWFGVSADFSEAVADAMERIEGRGDAKARTRAATAAVKATAAAREAHTADARAKAVSRSLDAYKAHTDPRIARATHAIDVTLPNAISGIRTAEDSLSSDLARLRARTKALEDGAVDTWQWIQSHPLSSVSGVFAGAVAIALARLGFGFLRCSAWKNAASKITCGMGNWISALLDLIATFGLAAVAVLDPEDLAKAAVDAVDALEPILTEILSR